MGTVFLILAHKNPKQLKRLITSLSYLDTRFVIHLDLKSEIRDFTALFNTSENVYFLTDRKEIKWGGFEMIEATISGLQFIRDNLPFTRRVTLLSGQDYPIKPAKYIHEFFESNEQQIFIDYFSIPCKHWNNGGKDRFPKFELIGKQIDLYGGSQWWSMPMSVLLNMLIDLEDYSDFLNYFEHVFIPDESFFQTYLLNCEVDAINNNLVNDNLRLILWPPPYLHPKTLFSKDWDAITDSTKLFARKFDEEIDPIVMDRIDDKILNPLKEELQMGLKKNENKVPAQAMLMLTNKTSAYDLFKKLKSELPQNASAFLLFHEGELETGSEQMDYQDIFRFNDSILTNLGFIPIHKKLLPGSNHFPLFSFFHAYPEYDYYWVIEDDVFFNGDWRELFEPFNHKETSSDFLSSHIRFQSEDPRWYWWDTLKFNEEGVNKDIRTRLASFNPIYRISKEALVFLELKLKEGWTGHHETLIPTLLFEAGFTLLDFGGAGSFCLPDRIHKFYKNSICSIIDRRTHSSLRYRPLVTDDEISSKIIYHPFKRL